MVETVTHPRFVYDSPEQHPDDTEALAAAEASFCIRAVERGIREDPHTYQRLLKAMGTAAETGTLSRYAPNSEEGSLDRQHEELLVKYFGERYDREVEFDESTEDALTEDTDHADVVGQSKDAKSYTVSKSAMSHKIRSHPDAERRRDMARVSRLAGYVARVTWWQEEHDRMAG